MITMFVVALVPLAPTEPMLIGMAVFASSGRFSLVEVIAVAAFGCTLSDHLLYATGRLAGVRLLDRLRGKGSVRAAGDWLGRHVTRWGAPVLVVGRWLPAGGTIGAVLAGTLRWNLPRFTPASVVGSTLWSTYVALIGYFGGALTGQPIAGLGLSLLVALVVGLLSRAVVQRLERDHGPAADPIEEPVTAG